jgi:hypothetical protein
VAILAVTVTDTIGLGSIILAAMLVVLSVPASYLAWRAVQAARRATEAERIGRMVHDQLERVLKQLTPSNGRTTAHHIEAIEQMIDETRTMIVDNKQDYTSAIAKAVDTITKVGDALDAHIKDHPCD